MTKQEFLAISLPYTLKCLGRKKDSKIHTILSCYFGYNITLKVEAPNYIDYTWHICDVKPILHPLSDLTKPIEHNGETFIPIEKIAIYDPKNIQYFIEQIYTGFIEYIVLKQLIEWHFDIADLISKDEAIDVNTLDKNPYK